MSGRICDVATRTSDKLYTNRPSRGSARVAWDILSNEGPLRTMRLLDGYWMCEREDGEIDEVEATYVLTMKSQQRAAARAISWRNGGSR